MDVVDIPVLALGVGVELVPNHSNHDLIVDETSFVHDLLRRQTQRGLRCDLRA